MFGIAGLWNRLTRKSADNKNGQRTKVGKTIRITGNKSRQTIRVDRQQKLADNKSRQTTIFKVDRQYG